MATTKENKPNSRARSLFEQYLALMEGGKRDRTFFESMDRLFRNDATRKAIIAHARQDLNQLAHRYALVPLYTPELNEFFDIVQNPELVRFEIHPDSRWSSAIVKYRARHSRKTQTVARVTGPTLNRLLGAATRVVAGRLGMQK